MPRLKPAKPDVITYGDHEVITPDTGKLRNAVRVPVPEEPDPVALAEQALAQISGEFSNWMHDECERLDAARRRVKERGLSLDTRQELFFAAHDIKGDSGTFGYPEAMPAAESLCRLLEHAPDLRRIPIAIVDQHVDAVRAIVREHARPDIAAVASTLTGRLREVTDEFLLAENRHRPEVLRVVAGRARAAATEVF
jgi:chemotaxis protein histidine kinase CheA